MTGPSSTPRGERAGTPGTAWETELVRMAEVVVPEDDGDPFAWADDPPRPNRATRRAIGRLSRRKRPG